MPPAHSLLSCCPPPGSRPRGRLHALGTLQVPALHLEGGRRPRGTAEARPAHAAHYVNEGNNCYGCHTLDNQDADLETSFIASVARTLPMMKALLGSTPARFGCTFCHNNPTNATMKDALSHFGTNTSKHAVGQQIAGGAESDGEYFSTVGSATSGELDCEDCHLQSLLAPGLPGTYVGHAPAGRGAAPACARPCSCRR